MIRGFPILLIALSLAAQPAWADCPSFLRRLVPQIERIEESVGNIRKNLSVRLFPPSELKNFDPEFFDQERTRVGQSSAQESLLDFPTLRFETKLAHLESAIQQVNTERPSLHEMLSSLPPYKKKRLVNAVNAIYSGKPVTETALEYRISELYIDLLKWHYPQLLEGAGAEQAEAILRATLEARLVSRNVAKTLVQAGILNTQPSVFRSFFQGLLKGQAVEFFINSVGNYSAIQGALSSNMVPYWILPPRIRFNRWIEIPEPLLLDAEERGLEPVWRDSILPYLQKRYGTLTRVDLIYTQLQKFWKNATYYAAMGWLAFTLTWTLPTEVSMHLNQKKVQSQFETVQPVVPAQEKALLENDSEKQAAWEAWARNNPEKASDPSHPDYQFMRKLIFRSNLPDLKLKDSSIP